MRAAALLLVLGGCDQLFGLDRLPPGDPASEVDASLGVIVDAATSCPSGAFYGKYGAGGRGLLDICVPSTIPATLTLPAMIDTDLMAQCDAVLVIDSFDTEACVKWARTINVASSRVIGPRALVLVGTEGVNVAGAIDVSSVLDGDRGAGSDWAGCQSNKGPDGPASGGIGGGGGAGGSFSTRGGTGGPNGAGAYTGARATTPADRVRGGCEGGAGGNAGTTTTLASGGISGKSGGAVYLISGGMLAFDAAAVVNASGAAGKGGGTVISTTWVGGGGGGGGGGSGGLIGLDAQSISIVDGARFFANGGGAGGGGGATTGMPGQDPKASAITTAAPGGPGGSTYGGRGGNGAAKTGNGAVGGGLKSGGGGGGGLGYIVIYTAAPPTTGAFSPAPSF